MRATRPRLVAALALLASASPALASFHLMKLKEVFPGTVAAPDAQYVMLQSYAAGQNFVGSHKIHVYDAAGTEVAGSPFTFPGTLANGPDQMEVLIATPEAASLFNVDADLPMTAVLPRTGGKVCYDTIDCIAWGSYHGAAAGVGTPFNAPVGLVPGQAMQRRLDICMGATTLEACDDTDNSANDFVFATPAPRNDAADLGTLPASTCGNNVIEGLESCDDGNTADGDGCSALCRLEPAVAMAQALLVDDSATAPPGANGILEPGEAVTIAPEWANGGDSDLPLTGTAAIFTGPAGATYSILQASADYGTLAPTTSGSCVKGGTCYSLQPSAPATRPAPHWDATLTEVLSDAAFHVWTLHVGGSFPDVPNTLLFYPFVETLFHNGVTGGCAGGNYCPANSVTRAQMAVFLLKAEHGSGYTPPVCGGIFLDVACPSPFADWIERLSAEGITGGCGSGNYCPDNPVTRRQMAVFLLKTSLGSSYVPPDAQGIFTDVPADDNFAPWIEDLYNREITGGCQASPLMYCPDNPNTRGQMAVFLVKSFGLLLYGP
ncbi:MAG TPA: S-layer homology domain-containing protein [Thermoanaerobaculia bacterium]|nr:S-layer homology domain-containing protein [Thermoanaerobaculia bacterium]